MSEPIVLRYEGGVIADVYELLAVLRVRPGMWIGEPSVTRLRAFLDGFYAATFMAGVQYSDGMPPFGGFHAWIADRCGSRMSQGWPELLLMAEGDEARAFDRFWIELEAFRAAAPTG